MRVVPLPQKGPAEAVLKDKTVSWQETAKYSTEAALCTAKKPQDVITSEWSERLAVQDAKGKCL